MKSLSIMEQKQIVGGTFTYKYFSASDSNDYGYGFGYSTKDEAKSALRRAIRGKSGTYHVFVLNDSTGVKEYDEWLDL